MIAGPRGLIAFVVIVAALLLPPNAYAAGELDSSFDGDGKVVTDFFRAGQSRADQASDVAVQPDGKIVAVGVSSRGNFAIDFAIARYNPNGSLDSTFGGGDGQVLTDFGSDDNATAVALQSDGKIVVAGWSRAGGNPFNFAIARYKPGGGLDQTFDGDGKVLTDFGADDSAFDVAVQSDGKIVAAGFSRAGNDFALARYNSNGSLDVGFDADGRVLTDFGDDDGALGVAIQSDGKIVAAGSTFAGTADPIDSALARYNSDGSLDPAFDGDGRVVTNFGGEDFATDVSIQADGKIVTAGLRALTDPTLQAGDFALARYNLNGSLDSSFDGDGRVVTDVAGDDAALGLTIQADGKIVAAGRGRVSGSSTPDFVLTRYNQGGTLDRTFTGDGKVLTDLGADDQAEGVAIQPDGKIVAAGFTSAGFPDENFALARYLPTGAQISVNDVTAFEGNAGVTDLVFTVSLSSPSTETITVTRETADGTATAPSDYTALAPATFTFSPGQTTKTAIVKVRTDLAVELDENLFLNLSNPTNATIADAQGVGKILNDDLSASAPCTVTGTPGDDVIHGSTGRDVLCGGNGDDQLLGFDGADVLKGGKGDDLLVGHNGFDLLLGEEGVDELRGDRGNDTLRGGDRGDTLYADLDGIEPVRGSDALFGDAGADTLNAQDGVSANDSADGGSGSDSCVFDSGDFVTSCP